MLLEGPDVFAFNTKGCVVHTALTVKYSREIRIPWALCFLAGIIPLARPRLLRIDEVVGVIAQGFADDKMALPRGRELVLAGCSLISRSTRSPSWNDRGLTFRLW